MEGDQVSPSEQRWMRLVTARLTPKAANITMSILEESLVLICLSFKKGSQFWWKKMKKIVRMFNPSQIARSRLSVMLRFQGSLCSRFRMIERQWEKVRMKQIVLESLYVVKPSERETQPLWLGWNSLLFQQIWKQQMKATVKMKLLTHITSWCLGASMFSMGTLGLFFSEGLDRLARMGSGTMNTRLLQTIVLGEKLQRLAMASRERGMQSQVLTKRIIRDSITMLLINFPSLTIFSIWSRVLTTKSALSVPSELARDMPTSASLMAIRSLAPSPTMHTLLLSPPNHISSLLLCSYSSSSLSFNSRTIWVLFSGETLANTFILLRISESNRSSEMKESSRASTVS